MRWRNSLSSPFPSFSLKPMPSFPVLWFFFSCFDSSRADHVDLFLKSSCSGNRIWKPGWEVLDSSIFCYKTRGLILILSILKTCRDISASGTVWYKYYAYNFSFSDTRTDQHAVTKRTKQNCSHPQRTHGFKCTDGPMRAEWIPTRRVIGYLIL